jgi:hypothetical protein
MSREIADEVFLLAFDKTIEEAYQQLAASGMGDEQIWKSFRRAAAQMVLLAGEIEEEFSAGGRVRREQRSRRPGVGRTRKQHIAARAVPVKSKV